MKERPILFSTPMVQALLSGTKTQTRRVVKLAETFLKWENEGEIDASFLQMRVKCPYGQPRDVLWVRETHYKWGMWIVDEGVFTKKGWDSMVFVPMSDEVRYFDNAPTTLGTKADCFAAWHKRPSLFMPREACRIKLLIKSIRVERLQDISEEDAIAEGIELVAEDAIFGGELYTGKYFMNYAKEGYTFLKPIDSYRTLWESINGRESWYANPWVWVVSFEKLNDRDWQVEPDYHSPEVHNEP